VRCWVHVDVSLRAPNHRISRRTLRLDQIRYSKALYTHSKQLLHDKLLAISFFNFCLSSSTAEPTFPTIPPA